MSLAFNYTVLVHIIHSKLVNIKLTIHNSPSCYCYELPYSNSAKHHVMLQQAAVHSPKSSQETK